ncbi:hypothetical protein KEU06_04630 [Pseudaminobacter sp. 19-2017]|uniref:Uncharacterized protein n=1 Tax=Pseudaminobacter soli (ex Zhang et al. 2022) TaxID=2831468 RepID=A0A942I270_9HYPH|nr:hypothetical protein [Pseudaminobacter soli]MBS3647914.1 hypothetical protein [Pseudaminobacter soli]
MRSGNDADRTDESRRIIGRVGREADGGLFSGLPTGDRPDRDAAGIRQDDDPIETWGTRIGRTLGFVLTIGLVLWFASYLLRGL